jgi:PEP-CTERM motif
MNFRSGAALAIAAFSSSQALATTYIVTYTGTVATSTVDSGGFFGSVNTSLAGLDFVATYTADDTTVGARYTSDPEFTTLIGGPGIPDPGPPPPILPGTSISPVGATLTINGITLRIGDINRFIGLVQKRDNIFSGADSLQAQVHERPTVGFGNSRYLQIAVFSTINNIFTTSAFGEPIDRTLAAGDQSNSSFSFVNTDANGFSQGSVSGTFAVSTVKVSTVNAAAVPEPTSWILMLAGFGFIGGSLRQEARKPRAA